MKLDETSATAKRISIRVPAYRGPRRGRFREITGAALTGNRKIVAGEAVHYTEGATLGVAYVLALYPR